MWSLRMESLLAAKLHCVHLCGFSPVWMKKWFFKWPAWLNDLLHWEQLYLLPPLWVCLWRERPLLCANVLGHKSQDLRSAIFGLIPPPLPGWHSFLMTTVEIRTNTNESILSLSLSPTKFQCVVLTDFLERIAQDHFMLLVKSLSLAPRMQIAQKHKCTKANGNYRTVSEWLSRLETRDACPFKKEEYKEKFFLTTRKY